MTPIDRFERRLLDELQELAAERFPDYTNDLLARTARTRQRPAWRTPERWLPMTIALRRPLLAPPLRLLAVGLALLLALLAALVVGGALLNPRPAPVLPAIEATNWKNGLIAFARSGDIWVVDPTSGDGPRLVVGGFAEDDYPDWSPDGTQLAFWRTQGAGMILMVADADGSNLRQVTPDVVIDPTVSAWSPDGTTSVIISTVKRVPTAWTIPMAGGDARTITTDGLVSSAAWRPDGSGLILRIAKDGLTSLVPVTWPDLVLADPIIGSDPTSDFYPVDRGANDLMEPTFSADGKQIVAIQGMDNGDGKPGVFGGVDTRNEVLKADGTDLHVVEFDPTSDYEDGAWFSPDGTRLLMTIRKGNDHQIAVLTLDGSAPPVATKAAFDSGALPAVWSPDGKQILSVRTVDGLANLIDPATGVQTPLPWPLGNFDWQPLPG